ncbi:MAG: zinc ribbon domain-containing protein [Proteobacteria bacterium]|nr:zinc ribbon domain-containing protein [Pseudomonadota bacterium]
MYSTCPKCSYQRQPADTCSVDECPGCGLIFSKWLSNIVEEQGLGSAPGFVPASNASSGLFRQFLLSPRPGLGNAKLLACLLIWIVFAAWGFSFVLMDFQSNEIGRSWFHNVDLIFHEAGHVIFQPLGRTLMILGGSLFQVLVPLILMLAFLIKNRDGFAASICLWWSGQSLMDVAPYIADARALRLPLLGGGTGADSPGMHDWANLLRPRGWLQYDIRIASIVDIIGAGVLLIALAWGAYMLYLNCKQRLG